MAIELTDPIIGDIAGVNVVADIILHTVDVNDISGTPDGTSKRITMQQISDFCQTNLLDFRGNYDASVNAWPSSGGSGAAGALLKGDTWYVSVAGVAPTGIQLNVGDQITARVDAATNADADWYVIAGGAVIYWSEARDATGANAAVPAHQWAPNGAEANIDVVLEPKGTGAFIAQIPDGLAANGTKRAPYAFDMQRVRTNSTQVAQGQYSIIIGRNNTTLASDAIAMGDTNHIMGTASIAMGKDNSAAGNYNVALGQDNEAAGLNAVAIGYNGFVDGIGASALGYNNSAITDYAVAIGDSNTSDAIAGIAIGRSNQTSGGVAATAIGNSNTSSAAGAIAIGTANTSSDSNNIAIGAANDASGLQATAIGLDNEVDGDSAVAIGGSNVADGFKSFVMGLLGAAHGVIGRFVQAAGSFTVAEGTAQGSVLLLGANTTGGGLTVLTSDIDTVNKTPSVSNQLTLQDNQAIAFKGILIAKRSGTTDVGSWDLDGQIVRGVGVATTDLQLNNVTSRIGSNPFDLPIMSADIVLGSLKVQVQGEGSNVRWLLKLDTVEVIYS